MIYENEYLRKTKEVINTYNGKDGLVKDYVFVCHKYIGELRNTDFIESFTELEYERMFNQVLELVAETYRPTHFVSCCSDGLIRLLDEQFMIYIIGIRNALIRPIKWAELCQLNYNFSIAEIKYKVKNGFDSDFTTHAIKQIKINELWLMNTMK